MRRLLVLMLLALPVSQALASAPLETSLVSVDVPDRALVGTLLSQDIMVVRDMESYVLVVAGPEELAKLRALGVTEEVLDESMTGKTYYTVVVRNESHLSTVQVVARTLKYDGFNAVMEATLDEARTVSAAGFEIARVFVRPIRLSSAFKPHAFKGTRDYDPLIQTMVNSVSGATVDSYVQRLQDFVTRYCTTDSCQAAADWLKAEYESYGIDSVYHHNFSTSYKDNVVAVIPGSGDPSKIVLIGGHYDSITSNINNCPGADDNASGTVCALECARVLSQYDFNYTLVFMAFGAEELGLYGSEAYAADAAARGDDIIGAIAVDMIGYLAGGDVMDLDIIDNSGSEWLRNLAFDAAGMYVPELPLVDGSLPGGAGSDHSSFWAHGYDAILFFEDTGDYSPYIHTASDVVGTSYNSSTLAERSVKVAVATIASLAEPFRVAIRHTPLEHTEDTLNPYPVTAEIVAAGTLDPDSLLVYYSTGAGWNSLTMTATGNPDEYEASIPAQPGGTFVDYYIVAEDTEGNRTSEPKSAPTAVHTFFVGEITLVWDDDFESDKGWTVGAPGDAASTGVWERCDPEWTEAQPEDDNTPDPRVLAYITECDAGSSQGSYDIDGGKTTLLSPILDLSDESSAAVRYYLWYANDTGSTPGEDSVRVDVSDDGGSSWVSLENSTASTHSWAFREFQLLDYVSLTDQMQFRFIAADEGDGSIVEAGVDDFSIVTFQEPTTPVAETGGPFVSRITLDQNVPNPFNPQTTIRFAVPEPGRKVSLDIYDVTGRRVASLVDNEMVSGVRTVSWDGTDGLGHEVSAGIYFYRLVAGKTKLTRKLVMVQ